MLFFLLYSVFLPPTPGGLHRRTYQASVPENQCTAQIQKTGQLFSEYGFLYIRMIQLRK